jgi:hypothetical protein
MNRYSEDKRRYNEAARKLSDQLKESKKKHFRHTSNDLQRQMAPIIHSGKQPKIKTTNTTHPTNRKSGPDLCSK